MDVIFLVQSRAYPNILLYKKMLYMNITKVDLKILIMLLIICLTKQSNRAHLARIKTKTHRPFQN